MDYPKNMKTILVLSLAFILSGCASTHRLDGGRSAIFHSDANGQGTGTEVEGPRIALLGGVLQLFSFTKRNNVASTIDEPSASAGYTAASKTAMENAVDIDVQLTVEMNAADNWLDAH